MNSFTPRDGINPQPSMPTVVYSSLASDNAIIDIRRLIGMLIDHKWWIALVVVVFILGGVIHASLQPPIYSSNALIQVERRGPVYTMAGKDGNGLIGSDEPNIAAEVEILRSRMVLGKVVDRLGLDTTITPHKLPFIGDYILRNGVSRPSLRELPLLGEWLDDWIGEGRIAQFFSRNPAVWGDEGIDIARFYVSNELRGRALILEVVADDRYRLLLEDDILGEGQSGVEVSFLDGKVLVRVEDIEAHEGAMFILLQRPRLNAIDMLAHRLSVTEHGAGGRGLSTGMLRLSLIGANQDEIRRTLDAIAEAFLLQHVERRSEAAQQSLTFLSEQAPELRAQLASAENKLSSYRASVDSIDLDTEGRSVIDQFIEFERQINELSIEEAELSQRFTTNHPSYQSLLRQKAFLTAKLDHLDQRVNAMPESQQEVIRLNRDVEVVQAIYVNVLNKVQELELTKASTIGSLRIIDPAAVRGAPISPNKPMIVAMAGFLGILLALSSVVLLGFFNRGVESPEQVENLGLPVYATVLLSSDQTQLDRMTRQRHRKAPGLLAQSNPTDMAIESLRGLRTSLHFAMLDAPNNSLMICGPSPDIGKSFVALNLGALCAQGGQRVLLIDADLRNGNLHHAFGHKSAGGLSEVLVGKLDISSAIRNTEIEGLEYLGRGTVPPNPSELLMNSRFTDLIDEVGARYDLVILDTPPVLAVTEAAIVGRRAGTTLMVTRFQRNPPKEIKLTINRLDNAGVEVKGCIINGIQHKAATAYGYGYYHYAYTPAQGKKRFAKHV